VNAARSRRARLVAAGALAAAVLGACGIPADDEPRAVSQEQLPSTTTTTVVDESQTVAVDLYFVHSEEDRDVLTTVEREVPVRSESGQPTPATVLESLLGGVTAEERDEAAVVNRIPPDTALASPPVLSGGTLTVDLDRRISTVQGDGARLAYGQMVCTMDALDEVERVLFLVEGEAVQPPDGNGEVSSAPLTCASYDNLLGG
jgi:spore germination protein GerM